MTGTSGINTSSVYPGINTSYVVSPAISTEQQTCYKKVNTCDYPYFKLTQNDTGTEFFNYVNSATTGGTEANWYAWACTKTASCKNGVEATGAAGIGYDVIYSKINKDSKTCYTDKGEPRYESVCTGELGGCGDKKTISTCESIQYKAYGRVPVIEMTFYTCGSCDTSKGNYDSESACQSATGRQCVERDSGCYGLKCSGYFDTEAQCLNGKASDERCNKLYNGCYKRQKPGYFTVKLNKNGGGLPYNYHPDVIYYTGSCQIDSTRLYIIVNGNTYSAYNTWRDEIEHEINESQTVSICVANDRKYNGGGKSTVQNIHSMEYYARGMGMSSPDYVCSSNVSSMCKYDFKDGGNANGTSACFDVTVSPEQYIEVTATCSLPYVD